MSGADTPTTGTDNEKGSEYTNSESGGHGGGVELYERPGGFKGLYSHPVTQVSMVGLVCFMGPGLFNALNGLGGGGQVDPQTGATANAALYGTFAGLAFFAGTINNKLGSKLTLLVGSAGYCLYIGSYLCLNINPGSDNFVIAAGTILGLCAALLWTAQGSLMMAYPTESQKGTFVAIFWSIFNLGGVIGSAVAVGQNWDNPSGNVTNGTYIGFLILTLIGVCIPMLLVDPKNIIRTDGTKVSVERHPTWSVEFKSLWYALRTDPMILLLFPLFFASNYFYTWQFNDFNSPLFNNRARTLNNLLYWTCQIFGSIMMGYILDIKTLSRRTRAFTGWGILFVLTMVVHGWGYYYQKQYTRESISPPEERLDIHDHGYAGRLIFYIFCAFLDSMWQTAAYWLMGAMSNDPAKLAHFAGFYKSIQSAGGAGAWAADSDLVPYMNMFASTWGLLVAGLLFALPMMYLRIKNTTTLEDEALVRMDDSGHIRDTNEVEGTAKTA